MHPVREASERIHRLKINIRILISESSLSNNSIKILGEEENFIGKHIKSKLRKRK